MKLTSIAVATAVGAALALGSVVPAQAAGEVVSVTPATLLVPNGCADRHVTINVDNIDPTATSYYLSATMVNGSDTKYLSATGTSLVPGPNDFTVFLCDTSTALGTWTVNAKLQVADAAYNTTETVTTGTVIVKGHASFASIAGRGKRGQVFHIHGKVANKGELAGSKVKVFLKKKGHKKFKAVDSAKIKANGKFKMASKKIQIGDRVYFVIKGKGFVVTTKTPTTKIVKVF
jgi:hypothetical protein